MVSNYKLTPTHVSLGFLQFKPDYSLFTKKSNFSFTVILVYVDDLVLIGNNIVETTNLRRVLDNTYNIKDLGHLKYFLDFEVARTNNGMSLCQQKYFIDLL